MSDTGKRIRYIVSSGRDSIENKLAKSLHKYWGRFSYQGNNRCKEELKKMAKVVTRLLAHA
jgi:hypothetical protein